MVISSRLKTASVCHSLGETDGASTSEDECRGSSEESVTDDLIQFVHVFVLMIGRLLGEEKTGKEKKRL